MKNTTTRHLCKHHTPSLWSQVALFPDRPDVQRGRSDHGSCGIRGPVSPLRTCRITARKLLNKRNTLTYDSPVLLHGASYVYLEGRGAHIGAWHTVVYTGAREEQKLVYIGSNPAHSALMNMPEHDSSTLPGQPPIVAPLSLALARSL